MSNYGWARVSVPNENWDIEWRPIKENSAFEEKEFTNYVFRCRPASPREKKEYRITKGVIGVEESQYIISSNIPEEIKPGDKVVFLGKPMIVTSVGYYFDQTRIISPNKLDPEYIMAKCPKGITIS